MSKEQSMTRILVVEDSRTNMELAVLVLEAGGHSVLQAVDAATGIALARSECPDLILMDVQLPVMSGLEATAILKADPATRDIPIIALTALAMSGDRERIMAAGCDGYLEKPIRYKTLLAEVEVISSAKG
jgi:CheY-like chemotaxis protein